ncbi:hypothetical protein, partial [Helicobacter kayseriensis]|uniref:hypothetical protein n=1 Tax=Helicobacter kayseriensis TaxID=2905877 RepID=UPI001E3E2E79
MKHQSTGNHQVYTTSGIRFRPLIAASLAVALGVSVASATNTVIDGNSEATLSNEATFSQDADLLVVEGGKAGVSVNLTANTHPSLQMQGHTLTFDGEQLNKEGQSEKIYGIFIDNESQHNFSVTGSASASLIFRGFEDGSKLQVIRNNASKTLTFTNVSILVGDDKTGGLKYGIQNNLSGVSYDFGAAGTIFKTITGDAATRGREEPAAATDAKAAVGALISGGANFAGKLTFESITGGSSAAAAEANANGANAYGLVTNAATLDLGQGEIIFTKIDGGAKKSNGGEKDGSVFAIVNSGNSAIKNGTIAITAIGESNTDAKYILQNQSGTLTFTNASIIAGDKGNFASTAGILSNIAGVSY